MRQIQSVVSALTLSTIAALATGCGGGSAIQPRNVWGGGGSKSAPSAARESSPASPSASADSARSESRQGLGTEWGERRVSQVRNVSFERAEDEPFATAMFRYNDERGARNLAFAYSDKARRTPATTFAGGLTISIMNDSYNPFPALRTPASTIVMGREGERYTIVLRNGSSHRVEAVATVDGLDVINGRTGSYSNRGYIVNPHASVEIDGFRRSERDVAAFRFGRVADSYAASKGDARNVGVIGIALFAEDGDPIDGDDDMRLRESATPFPDERFAQPPR